MFTGSRVNALVRFPPYGLRGGSRTGNKMIIHDISIPIDADTPVYEGDPPIEITLSSALDQGDNANVSRLVFGAHTGTHVDAPLHFYRDGKAVHELSLEVLIGPAEVIDLVGRKQITRAALLASGLAGKKRVLLKTSNSSLWREKGFQKDFAFLDENAAQYLVESDIELVGIDYLSIEEFGTSNPATHLKLLAKGIIIVEGLDLSDIKPGAYTLICLPLLLRGCEGSPCRAVLLEDQEDVRLY